MAGIILVGIAELFAELSISLGRKQVRTGAESVFAFGFLSAIWATCLFIGISIFLTHDFRFSSESIPTFVLRAILEVILIFMNLHAIVISDRTTFSFLHTFTIPFLLIVDLTLGFSITALQIIGMCLILSAVAISIVTHGLRRKGMMLCIAASLLAVCTLSLYKYNITHFNSVEAEQGIMYAIFVVAMLIAGRVYGHENTLLYLTRPLPLLQSLASGIGTLLMSFAYPLAPASVILTGKRSFEVLAAIVAGRIYFHEKHVVLKVLVGLIIVVGLMLMIPTSS